MLVLLGNLVNPLWSLSDVYINCLTSSSRDKPGFAPLFMRMFKAGAVVGAAAFGAIPMPCLSPGSPVLTAEQQVRPGWVVSEV